MRRKMMTTKPLVPTAVEGSMKRKGGAPKGNQNARKHGFYSKILTPQQQETLPGAANLDGLDREIAILRVKIRSILANDPRNVTVLSLALSSLARLLRARQLLARHDRQEREGDLEALAQVVSRLISTDNLRLK
jgi:hypothetical protein